MKAREPRTDYRTRVLLGGNIRLARTLAGITQEELAAVLGMTVNGLRQIECGARRLSAARIVVVARTLGVPLSFLFRDRV